jgi:hypothetical protein
MTATLACAASMATASAPPALQPADDETPPPGCGWFESSLDLSQGLAVVEHAGFDGLHDVAPLAWQLGAWL